jgi:hypothetical protein
MVIGKWPKNSHVIKHALYRCIALTCFVCRVWCIIALMFSPNAPVLVVGSRDGSVDVFRLHGVAVSDFTSSAEEQVTNASPPSLVVSCITTHKPWCRVVLLHI